MKKKQKRQLGIDIIKEVPWGTHLCQFYKTKKDLLDILLPYFKEGLENNEFCMWITSKPLAVESAKRALRKVVKNLDDYIKKGQIEFLHYNQWYTKSGKFEANKVLRGWIEKENQALNKGFDGLRLTGNTFWLEKKDWKDFALYEKTIDNMIGKYRMIAICTYSLNKCKTSEIIDVVSNHQFALIRQEGGWEFIESAERRRIQEALNKTEKLYCSFLQNFQGIAYHCDLNFKPVFFHGAVEDITGYSQEEFITGKIIWDQIIHPDELPYIYEYMKEIISIPEYSNEREYRIIRKDGQIRWLHELLQIICDELGNPILIQGTIYDITESKKVTNALRESEKKYRQLIENLNEGIWVIDEDAYTTFVNPRMAEMLGYTAEEMQGMQLFSFMDERNVEIAKYNLKPSKQGTKDQHDFEFFRKDGTRIYTSLQTSPITDNDGSFRGTIAAVSDITDRKQMEGALRDNEETARALLNGITDIAALINKKGIILDLNKATAHRFNKKVNELIGMYGWDLVPPTLAEHRKTFFDQVIQSGGPVRFEDEHNGIWYDNIFYPIFVDGKVGKIVVLARDITNRKHMEEELRAEKEFSENMLNALVDVVFVFDPDSGKPLRWNKAMSEVSGCTNEEIASKRIPDDWYSEEDLKCAALATEKIFQEGQVTVEMSLITKDGRSIPTEYSGSIVKDKKGNPKYIITVGRDITERKRTERELEKYRSHLEEIVKERTAQLTATNMQLRKEIIQRRKMERGLRESEKKFRSLIESAIDYIYILDKNGTILQTNPAAVRRLGYSEKELTGCCIADFFTSASKKIFAKQFPILLEKGTNQAQVELVCKDKKIITVDCSASGIYEEEEQGKPSQFVVIQRDITERKRVEKELQRIEKLEAVSILAGGIAHDFNNMLNAVLASLSMAELYVKQEDKVFEILRRIKNVSRKASELTHQLLTFSKEGTPIKKTASISEMIMDTAKFVLRGSTVKCEFLIPNNIWPVEIDKGQISQVINNLIINAEQAMPSGGIIRICMENVVVGEDDNLPLNKGKFLKISLKDEGIGIAGKYLHKIFDPYFTTKKKGIGLGLTISYSIIKNHNGYITAESELGVGTTFHIYLPASEKRVHKEKEEIEEELHYGKGKILLLEDNEDLLFELVEMITYLGYEIEAANEGSKVIDLYKEAKEKGQIFAAVILDLTVPGGMGAKETIRKLLKIDSNVKAIVSSGYSNDPIIFKYKQYGFSGAISKPYEIKELSNLLYKVTGKNGLYTK